MGHAAPAAHEQTVKLRELQVCIVLAMYCECRSPVSMDFLCAAGSLRSAPALVVQRALPLPVRRCCAPHRALPHSNSVLTLIISIAH
jgi:hypothetical protein